MMERKKQNQAQGQYDPQAVAEIMADMAYSQEIRDDYVDLINQWHTNINLCVDLTTHLHDEPLARTGKCYTGLLRRDNYDKFSFLETYHAAATVHRNPHVFRGRYINVTRAENGQYRPTFRPMPQVSNTTELKRYAWEVCCELQSAFEGLLPKAKNHEILETQGN